MKIIAFVLSFVLTSLCGFIVEFTTRDLHTHAKQTLNGRPLPPSTEWIYNTFAKWANGNILCVFLIPWVLLLLYSLLAPRNSNSADRSIRLLFGFLCFALCEAFLLVFMVVSSLLPFFPNYGNMPPEAPASAYIPNLLLLLLFIGVLVVAGWQTWQRLKKAKA